MTFACHHRLIVDEFIESVLDRMDLTDLERNVLGLAIRREVETELVPGIVVIQAVFHAADAEILNQMPEWLDRVSSVIAEDSVFLLEMGWRLDSDGVELLDDNLGLLAGESEFRMVFEAHLWEMRLSSREAPVSGVKGARFLPDPSGLVSPAGPCPVPLRLPFGLVPPLVAPHPFDMDRAHYRAPAAHFLFAVPADAESLALPVAESRLGVFQLRSFFALPGPFFLFFLALPLKANQALGPSFLRRSLAACRAYSLCDESVPSPHIPICTGLAGIPSFLWGFSSAPGAESLVPGLLAPGCSSCESPFPPFFGSSRWRAPERRKRPLVRSGLEDDGVTIRVR